MNPARAYLEHMRDALSQISVYRAEGRDNFFRDRKTREAVIRNFEVLGEAANRVPGPVQAENPSIPWRRMAGMRNRLIHE